MVSLGVNSLSYTYEKKDKSEKDLLQEAENVKKYAFFSVVISTIATLTAVYSSFFLFIL